MMLYFLFCSLIKCWSFLSSFYGARKVLSLGWRLLTGLPTRARTTSQSTKSSLLNLTKLKRRWEKRYSLFPSRKKSLSSDRCDDCGRQPVGAWRGVLPQVDDAAGLGVSAVNLSPFCQLFVTIVNFCLLQLFWSTWSTWSAGPRERRGQAGQDQHHGDHDPQRWWSVQVLESLIFNQILSSDPGSFQFEKRGHLVKESCGEAVLSVIR